MATTALFLSRYFLRLSPQFLISGSQRGISGSLFINTKRRFPISVGNPFTLLRNRRIKRYQSTSSATPNSNTGNEPANLSLFQRFKAMYKDYWYVLVPVHVVTSLGWMGGFYYSVASGLDLSYYMKKMGFSDSIIEKVTGSGAGNLAVAYALYKISTPLRYTVTLGGTTLAINQLRKLGYIRPAKEIYTVNKAKLKELSKRGRDKGKPQSQSPPSSKDPTP